MCWNLLYGRKHITIFIRIKYEIRYAYRNKNLFNHIIYLVFLNDIEYFYLFLMYEWSILFLIFWLKWNFALPDNFGLPFLIDRKGGTKIAKLWMRRPNLWFLRKYEDQNCI